MLCREANDEQPFVEQQLPSVELHRSKGRFLFPSLLGQNVPLCAVEHIVNNLGDVSATAMLLSHTQMPPTTLAPLREDVKNRGGLRWGVLAPVRSNC